jgi:hypothetical protein
VKIDNFALTMHQTCPAKYDLRIRQGWSTRHKSGALGFGGALHAGMAVWYKTGSLELALLEIHNRWPEGIPVDDFRTKEKCITVMIEYTRHYPSEAFSVVGAADGNPMIEVPFTIDLERRIPFCSKCMKAQKWDATHCDACGEELEPIEYGGIFDGLIEFSRQVFVLEHKSTSVMGPSYFNQFKPNNQISGYIWAGGELSGKDVAGAMVNAIGVYKSGATKFDREITSRSPLAIGTWKRNVQSVCAEIKYHEVTGHWPLRTNACTLYGLCEFHSVHVLEHEAEQKKRLEVDYIQDRWDYELREA